MISNKPTWHPIGRNPRAWALGTPCRGNIIWPMAEVIRIRNGSWNWYIYSEFIYPRPFGNEPSRLLAEIEATKIVLTPGV